MNKQVIRIVAAVLDTGYLTLYKQDGETITIPQGDPRIRRIIDVATPMLVSYKYADIDLGTIEENQYAKFEEKSSGVVRFFKVAKDKLKGLFGVKPGEETEGVQTPIDPVIIGTIPGPATIHLNTAGIYDVSELDEAEAAAEQVGQSSETKKVMNSLDEIMKHAVPASSDDFHERSVHKQGDITDSANMTEKQPTESMAPDTIIAVIDGKVIPGMELIKSQFTRAAKLGSTIGVENFLRRIASVIDQRQHSVDDLLKFLERGDLPIADDGSILIYKVLNHKGDRTSGKYMDCHSGQVEQWTGAYVCMDPKLVDHNRRTECSNGLHVARRGYIRDFSGNVCVLAKLAPEDVIAVPTYDANKMRVCGYHILMELSNKQYGLVRSNRPITEDEEGKQLLAYAIAGHHVRMTHEVRVTGHKGSGVVVTPLENGAIVTLASGSKAPLGLGTSASTPVTKPSVFTEEKPAPVEALSNPSQGDVASVIQPKTVSKEVEAEVVRAKSGRQVQAAALYEAWDNAPESEVDSKLATLIAFKKASKISWDKLGITDPRVIGEAKSVIKEKSKLRGSPAPKVSTEKFDTKVPVKIKKEFKHIKAKTVKIAAPKTMAGVKLPTKKQVKASSHPDDVTADQRSNEHPSDKREVNEVQLGLGSPRERIQKLLANGLTSVGVAGAILKLKKDSKKSWDILGVTAEQVEQIVKLAKTV